MCQKPEKWGLGNYENEVLIGTMVISVKLLANCLAYRVVNPIEHAETCVGTQSAVTWVVVWT